MAPASARHLAVPRFAQIAAWPEICEQAPVHANGLPGAAAPHELQPLRVKVDAAGRLLGVVLVPRVKPIGLLHRVGNGTLGRYDLLRRDKLNRNGPERSDAVIERIGALLGRDADVRHAAGSAGAARLSCIMQRRGAIARGPGKLPTLKAEATPVAGMDQGHGRASGVVDYGASKGRDRVERRGDLRDRRPRRRTRAGGASAQGAARTIEVRCRSDHPLETK